MKKIVMKKWVAALLSGEYRQAKRALRNKDGFCCLGVLCDLAAKEGKGLWSGRGDSGEVFIDRQGHKSETDLPKTVKDWAGMHSAEGVIKGDLSSLAEMNDCGASFKEIAKTIEQKWKEL